MAKHVHNYCASQIQVVDVLRQVNKHMDMVVDGRTAAEIESN